MFQLGHPDPDPDSGFRIGGGCGIKEIPSVVSWNPREVGWVGGGGDEMGQIRAGSGFDR